MDQHISATIEGYAPYQQPAHLHVIWHREDSNGAKAAQQLYRTFTRNYYHAWGTPLGVPVMYHPVDSTFLAIDDPDPAIPIHLYIILLSNHLNDDWAIAYGPSLKSLMEASQNNPTGTILLPVGLRGTNVQWPTNPAPKLLYYPNGSSDESKIASLELRILQLLTAAIKCNREASEPKIKVYLSYNPSTEAYWVGIVQNLLEAWKNNQVYEGLVEIVRGIDRTNPFSINNSLAEIANSVLVVILTDDYSSDYNCRREIHNAKLHSRPIVIVDALDNGCERLSALIGNLPIVHWDPDRNLAAQVLRTALHQHLRFEWNTHQNKSLLKWCPPGTIPLPDHPDRLQLIQKMPNALGTKQYFLIPDPPIAPGDVILLQDLGPETEFLTPTSLFARSAMQSESAVLPTKTKTPRFPVAISISEVDANSLEYARTNDALHDAMGEIARHLIISSCSLHYGGNLVHPKGSGYNYIEVLNEIVASYGIGEEGDKNTVFNYIAWPLQKIVKEEELEKQRKFASILMIPPIDPSPSEPVDPDPRQRLLFDLRIWSLSLTQMRNTVHQNVQARIVFGGRLTGYKGRMPGIVEEAYLAIKAGIPIFVIGAYGGCSRVIAEAMHGANPQELTLEWQNMRSPDTVDMLNTYSDDLNLIFDYQDIIATFKAYGNSPSNGLSIEENRSLAITRSVDHAVQWILKGLNRLKAQKNIQ
jgi:hypothetical protein